MAKFDSSYLFPFVFWVFISITVILRQYLWLNFTLTSYNNSLIRVIYKPLLPLSFSLQNRSYQNIFIQNIQIPLASLDQKYNESIDISQLTQISLIGTLVRGMPVNIYPTFILHKAQIVSISTQRNRVQKFTYPIANVLQSLSNTFVYSLFKALSPKEAGLTAGILLGGNQRYSYEFREKIRQAGLLHLTAVSGYNITILISSTVIIFRLFGKRIFIIPGVIAVIIFFTFITGGGASVIRAALMGGLGFLALQAGSSRSTKRIFIFVALLMIVLKPAWLWDVGWQLSVAATASMILITPIISKKLKRVPVLLNQFLSSSLSAYLVTYPIIIWHFGWENISLVGLLANFFAQPLIPFIMAFGAAIGFTGMIWSDGAWLLGIISRPPIWVLVEIIERGARLNQLLL